MLNIFKEKYVNVLNLAIVIEVAFCLPGSNASIKQEFSIITVWTDVRNQMQKL